MLRTLRHFFAIAVPVILVLVMLFVLLCHLNRWDEFVVITLIPIWAWAATGVLVSIIAWPTLKSGLSLLTFALWTIVGVALSDETAGLLREFHAAVTGGKPPAIAQPVDPPVPMETLRVVTLNCDDATAAATANLKKLEPDIVLLQEAPDRAALIDLTSNLFGLEGTFIRSDQCAILARGRLGDSVTESHTGSLVAVLERPGGERIALVNAHLPRATPRFDVWTAECWAELTERRKMNRRTLRDLLALAPKAETSPATALLVGGSFGAPPSDDIFRLLRNRGLRDSFRQAGYGWGNTFPSTLSVLRVDQIWISGPFLPERSETLITEHSDHRYVVSDFLRPGPGKLAGVSAGSTPGFPRQPARR